MAIPTGVARFGSSTKAYLVIPLLGAFFIDIVDATLVQFLLGLPLFSGAPAAP